MLIVLPVLYLEILISFEKGQFPSVLKHADIAPYIRTDKKP